MMKSINSIQLKNKIPLENLNVTKTKKKKKTKSKATYLILKLTKKISYKENWKNNKMVKDLKKLLKKQKNHETCIHVNFVNQS